MHPTHYEQVLDVTVVIANKVGLFAFFKVVAGKLVNDGDWLCSCRVMKIVGKYVDATTDDAAALVVQAKLSQSHCAPFVSLVTVMSSSSMAVPTSPSTPSYLRNITTKGGNCVGSGRPDPITVRPI